jgi:LCP family protein required for cell wall assembly
MGRTAPASARIAAPPGWPARPACPAPCDLDDELGIYPRSMGELGATEPQPRNRRELSDPARTGSASPGPQGPAGPVRRHSRKAAIAAWAAGILTGALVIAAIGVYAGYRHLNGNIRQLNISGLVGPQPPDHHPHAENIVIIGSDSRHGQRSRYGNSQVLTTDQSDTLMIAHIPANRQYAEVMSIPRDSWVNIPSCRMGNGQRSQPQVFKINEAFAIGNLDGNHTALGIACTIKTVEHDTGIHIDHFVAVNFAGFRDMVNALHGVPECNAQPIDDPLSGLHLKAGHHILTGTQALGYVRARYTLGNGSDLERIGRQQAFMAALVRRVKGELLNPVAIYRFLDAATRSITIDSQLGGISGLYNLARSLKGLPSSKITFFTVPTYPRSLVDPQDLANVMWTQPLDSRIFQAFRDDVPVSKALLRPHRPPRLPARDVRVAVLNGTGQFGLAASVAAVLQQAGFTVTRSLDISSRPTQTVIRYRAGHERQASRLGAEVRGAAFQRVAKRGPALALLLGGNYGTTAQASTGGPAPVAQTSPGFTARQASQRVCTLGG